MYRVKDFISNFQYDKLKSSNLLGQALTKKYYSMEELRKDVYLYSANNICDIYFYDNDLKWNELYDELVNSVHYSLIRYLFTLAEYPERRDTKWLKKLLQK